MLKAVGVSAGVLAMAVMAVGSTGPAQGSGAQQAAGSTVRVYSTNTEESFADVGSDGPGLGDMFVFRSNLARGGHRVGHTGVVCTITSAHHDESQCLGSAKINGQGELTIQGLIAGNPKSFSFAITGGTGAYEGAQGTLTVYEVSNKVERLTFTLTN